jgi:predicted outer membrane repeat protein
MEDRVVPATRLVTHLQDAVVPNELSLREAVEQLNGIENESHTITFAENIQGETITLDPTKSQLLVSGTGVSIHIDGSGSFMSIQRDPNAQQKHRLFDVQANSSLSLANLGLYWGSVEGESGGAVRSNGGLIINNCQFEYNTATAAGGAIAAIGGSLAILDSGIYSNSAEYGGGISIGQGVASAGIYGGFISGNGATRGGGIAIQGSDGQTAKTVILDRVEVTANWAQEYGGGIFVDGGAAGTDLTLQNQTWIGTNWAVNSNDPQFDTRGGGIYFGKGTLRATSVTIAYNEANTGDGMYRKNGTTLVGAELRG